MTTHLLLFALVCWGNLVVSGQHDFAKPFQDCGLEGSITIYDYKAQQWMASDIHDSEYATLPASTFKIINT